MSFSIKFGNLLYNHAFFLYRPLYALFKNRQDKFEISLLKKHVNKGSIVLDIGANIGFYATILADLTGRDGQVHCFEPDKNNFNYLQKAVRGKSNIVSVNKAVGPTTGILKIYTSKNLNVDHRTYKPEDYLEEIEIESVSIDEYLKQHGVRSVDLIKMDIQGFEMEAVKGMETTISQNPKLKIISEFWPYGLRKAGSSVNEYFQFLEQKGFYCYLLEKSSLVKLTDAKVKELEPLGEEHYFNILASRDNV